MNTTSITIELPNDLLQQIDARLPRGMTRSHLASLLVGAGLISSRDHAAGSASTDQLTVTDEDQIRIGAAIQRLHTFIRHTAGNNNGPVSTNVLASLDALIGTAVLSGAELACELITGRISNPAQTLTACQRLADELGYQSHNIP